MNQEPNKNELTKELVQDILGDIDNLMNYITRMKGLGIKVPEAVMISQLQTIKDKYNKNNDEKI